MSEGNQKAIDKLADIIKEMELKLELSEIAYRIEHQDYQIVFADSTNHQDSHHVEIQEALIEAFIETKDGDAKKEIKYKLSHPLAYEQWEKEDNTPSVAGEKMDIDKDL